MRIAETIADLRILREELLKGDSSIALVPTMGALHAGHVSLIRKAREIADTVLVSIFVNPTQFGPTEDFGRYPRPLERDLSILEKERVDALFLPSASEMYPGGYQTYVIVEELSQLHCGQFRPGHFRGVATIVLKLLNLVQPTAAVFGQKDAQQCVIIQRMVNDLNLGVRIVIGPTVRETDGLAVSSRNQYLSPTERTAAAVLYRSLQEAEKSVQNGERRTAAILSQVTDCISKEPLARLQYAELVKPLTLSPLRELDQEGILLLAVFIGRTRLIDNIRLRPSNPG
ncbi:MAG TPA: pantoate--beta-alanine ligase [Terriglobia bacterium]|nr:pantoate--beta-alanine ligase [Terriglobia bacterium]